MLDSIKFIRDKVNYFHYALIIELRKNPKLFGV